MKIHIKTFGCQMNVSDSEKMRCLLQRRGYEITPDPLAADLVIVNSCAVRAKAQEKIFSFIGRLEQQPKVVVAGCVAQAERDKLLKKNRKIDFVVGTHQFYHIDRIADQLLNRGGRGANLGFSREWTHDLIPDPSARDSGVTGYISIMEGCNNFCSYCIVPFTRGREKHRPFDLIMDEVRCLSGQGYQEIVLLGQNVNNWRDRERNISFARLLEHIAREADVRWIRFITSYPGYHDPAVIKVMEKYPAIARHIHFPAQSGSTRILKKMNRSYTREQYLKIIENYRKQIPGIRFSSDFIVGFPTETENDFKLTVSMLQMVEYESIFSFIYSPRINTRALKLKDETPVEQKKERLFRLQDVQRDIQLKNNRSLVNTELDVLITAVNPKKKGEVIGRTETYRVVNFVSRGKPGEFRRVRVKRVGPYSLRGEETVSMVS